MITLKSTNNFQKSTFNLKTRKEISLCIITRFRLCWLRAGVRCTREGIFRCRGRFLYCLVRQSFEFSIRVGKTFIQRFVIRAQFLRNCFSTVRRTSLPFQVFSQIMLRFRVIPISAQHGFAIGFIILLQLAVSFLQSGAFPIGSAFRYRTFRAVSG